MKKKKLKNYGNHKARYKILQNKHSRLSKRFEYIKGKQDEFHKLIMDIAHMVHNEYGDNALDIDRYTPGSDELFISVRKIILNEKKYYDLYHKVKDGR